MKYLALGLVALGLFWPAQVEAQVSVSVQRQAVRRGVFPLRRNVVRQRTVLAPHHAVVAHGLLAAPFVAHQQAFRAPQQIVVPQAVVVPNCLGGHCQQSLRVQRFHHWGF